MLEFRVHDITLVFIGKDKEREREWHAYSRKSQKRDRSLSGRQCSRIYLVWNRDRASAQR